MSGHSDAAGARIDDDAVADLSARLPDPSARSLIIELCTPLAHRIARRFSARGADHDDLSQVAVLGLIKAIDRFDPSREGGLLPYATVVITGELKHYIRDRSELVRLPRRLRQNVRIVEEAIDDLMQRNGRSPTMSEVASATGLREDVVLEAHAVARHGSPLPIDPIGADATLPTLSDGTDAAERAFLEEWSGIEPSLLTLDPRQRRILYLRFYEAKTQTQIAGELGMSQVHVSRLLTAALDALRKAAV